MKRFHEKDEKHEKKCRYCELMFDTQKLSKHEFDVHNHNSEICVLCGKKLLKSRLDRHMTLLHGEKNIPCDICGKLFKSQFNRERHHLKVHQPDSEKPFKCSYAGCERAFINPQSLESHSNSHLGLKPYQCDFCETRFQNTSNKAAHLKNVHKFSKN